MRFRLPAVALSVSILVLAAGCGGGGGSKGGKGGGAGGGQPSTTAAQSDAAATQEITAMWQAFFQGGAGTAAQLQDGDTLQQLLAQNQANPLAKQSSAKVKTVVLLKKADCDANALPSPCAQVTYDVLVNGSPALPNSSGYAVRQNNQWKVSKSTFCGLIALGNGGKPPAGCA